MSLGRLGTIIDSGLQRGDRPPRHKDKYPQLKGLTGKAWRRGYEAILRRLGKKK